MRSNPVIYEINTWVWLAELGERYGRPVTLGNVPDQTLDDLAAYHPDAIWLMGVWERSPRGREIALNHPDLRVNYERALPGYNPEDVVGSPYAVHRYEADARLGGPEGLAAIRARLKQRGIGLILDYVPNHVAVDHPWTVEAPEALVQGTEADMAARPDYYFHVPENGLIFAHGRDPYFPAWTDTVQVNAFSPVGREQARATAQRIADQCDGVRCDMAMLLLNRVFEKLWNQDADRPTNEFWQDIIPAVKAQHPGFLFMAEVYWDLEAELQWLGFDYTYDKRLYDRLRHENVHTVRDHLLADSGYQRKMVRFVENHDEDRAVAAFGLKKSEAAAALVLTLPGAKLIYEGQFEGRQIRLPVQLARREPETVQEELVTFYQRLLDELNQSPYHDGTFMMLAANPILNNDRGYENLLAYAWALRGKEWRIIVVNYSDQAAKGRIMLPYPPFEGLTPLRFRNVLVPGEPMTIYGDNLLTSGLALDIPPYGVELFTLEQG